KELGSVRFEDVIPGKYTASVEGAGFPTLTQQVLVSRVTQAGPAPAAPAAAPPAGGGPAPSAPPAPGEATAATAGDVFLDLKVAATVPALAITYADSKKPTLKLSVTGLSQTTPPTFAVTDNPNLPSKKGPMPAGSSAGTFEGTVD